MGRIAALASYVGYKSHAYDKDYADPWARLRAKRSPMDINSRAGFVLLGNPKTVFCDILELQTEACTGFENN